MLKKLLTFFTADVEVKEKSNNGKKATLIVYPNPNKRVISTDGSEVKSISSSNTDEISQEVGVLSGCEDIARLFSSYEYQLAVLTENDDQKVCKVTSLKPVNYNGKKALEVKVSTNEYEGNGFTAKNALSFENISSKQKNVTLMFHSVYPSPNLAQILENNLKNFVILSTAIIAADLENDHLVKGLFEGTKEYTFFPPTDLGFKKLPDGTVDDLLKQKNKLKLQSILEDHVCKGKLSVADIKKKKYLRAVSGKRLKVRVDDDGNVFVANAKIVTANVPQAHGYSHVINRVLLPDAAIF